MPSDPKVAKKPYSSPSLAQLDASTARGRLKAKGDPQDEITHKMLSWIDEQLKKTNSNA